MVANFRWAAQQLVSFTLLFALAACGGGGGGSVGGGSSSVGFALSTTNITFTAARNSTTPALQGVGVSASGGTVYLLVSASGPYTYAQLVNYGGSTATIEISATYPSMVPGSYRETVTVRGCKAADCSTGEVSGSPKVINVTYTVTWPNGSVGSACTGNASSTGAAGSLDTDFCGTGHLVFDSIFRTNGDDDGRAIVLDSGGNILIGGSTHNDLGNYDTAVWRFSSAGAVDTSFGTDYDSNGVKEGFVTYDGATGSYRSDVVNGIAVDASGRIVVVGTTDNGQSTTDMIVLRYTSAGVLDTTFGNNGRFIHNGAAGGNGSDVARGVAIDSNGNIVVAGYSVNAAGNFDVVVWRLLDNGTLDTSFGGDYDTSGTPDGYVVHGNAAGGNGNDFGNAIIIDGNGRILVAGSSSRNPALPIEDRDMVVWRFTATGALDSTFGGDYNSDLLPDGFVLHDGATAVGSYDGAAALALDINQRIVVAGSSFTLSTDYELVVWRLTSNGILDTAFGGDYNSSGIPDGFVRWGTGSSWDSASAVAVDTSNRSNDLVVLRHTSSGVLDSGFGTGGATYFPNAQGKDVVLKASGEILITGSFYNGTEYDMAIWQLVP
jgi:uncharacterized delta-60 repeat protein